MKPGEEFESYLSYIGGQRRYSPLTLENYSRTIRQWYAWLSENELFGADIFNVDRRFAKNYAATLAGKTERTTLHNKISALRGFHKHLMAAFGAKSNPFSGLPLPKKKKDLPVFLTPQQTERLLSAPWGFLKEERLTRFEALRDSLIMEFAYGAGLRVSELCSLRFRDIEFSAASARVTGKGGKTRMAPFGKPALELLKAWRSEFRAGASEDDCIFTSDTGAPLYPRFVQRMLKNYLAAANLPPNITPHKLRHSFATHMVDSGADLRAVQEMLGHASLSTTQIYTHLNLKHLKKEHSRFFE